MIILDRKKSPTAEVEAFTVVSRKQDAEMPNELILKPKLPKPI